MTYSHLAEGRNEKQLAELDLALAPDEERQMHIDRMNAAEMARYAPGYAGGPKPVPLPHKRRKPA
jgi:hypothetical protein